MARRAGRTQATNAALSSRAPPPGYVRGSRALVSKSKLRQGVRTQIRSRNQSRDRLRPAFHLASGSVSECPTLSTESQPNANLLRSLQHNVSQCAVDSPCWPEAKRVQQSRSGERQPTVAANDKSMSEVSVRFSRRVGPHPLPTRTAGRFLPRCSVSPCVFTISVAKMNGRCA